MDDQANINASKIKRFIFLTPMNEINHITIDTTYIHIHNTHTHTLHPAPNQSSFSTQRPQPPEMKPNQPTRNKTRKKNR